MHNDFICKEVINKDNIEESSINKYVKRPRAIIVNSSNEVLIAYNNQTTHFEFPGGHLEGDETIDEALIREVKEETGIDLTNNHFYPFYFLKHLCKDFPEKGVNTSIEFFYYVVYTDKKVNMNDSNLDLREQLESFAASYVPIEEIEDILKENLAKTKELNDAATDIYRIWQAFIANLDEIRKRKNQ